MYGGHIMNEGKDTQQYDENDFKNAYQNEEDEGTKMFLVLWLHAYKYTYKDIVVKTKVPEWASIVNNSTVDQNISNIKQDARQEDRQ